jgi:hypothetical protein
MVLQLPNQFGFDGCPFAGTELFRHVQAEIMLQGCAELLDCCQSPGTRSLAAICCNATGQVANILQ